MTEPCKEAEGLATGSEGTVLGILAEVQEKEEGTAQGLWVFRIVSTMPQAYKRTRALRKALGTSSNH